MTYDLLLESHSRGKRKRNRKFRSVAGDNDESLINIDVELLAISGKLPALQSMSDASPTHDLIFFINLL